MNHRKHKQSENSKRPKKEVYNPYANDPPDAKCPYCGQRGKICSYINAVSRGWGRGACKKKHLTK
jgi:hypothetical protein